MRDGEIRVKQIRPNQGLGVQYSETFFSSNNAAFDIIHMIDNVNNNRISMCWEFCCILSDQKHFSKAYMKNR